MTDINSKNPRRVTLKMIAEQTGFTINTVSHALNGKSDISARTTEIIKRKAQEMGYINDMTASALRSGFTKTIALILPNVANPFWAVLIKGINLELYRAGYTSLIMDTDETSHLEYRAVQSAISRKVDGIIICPNQLDTKAIQLIEKHRIPYILLGRKFEDFPASYVIWDDENGGFLATSHLLSLGKRKILFLNGPRHISSSAERFRGYCRALASYQIPYDPALVAETTISAAGDNNDLLQILKQDLDFDAIFAFSDFIAWEIMVLLPKLKQVDISQIPIIGFDDIQSDLRLPLPFTTIGADKTLEVRQVVQSLLKIIKEPDSDTCYQIIMPTHLVFHNQTENMGASKEAFERTSPEETP